MIEREVKILIDDPAAIRQRLEETGFCSRATRFERNTLYDTPDGSLARQRKLLRIREYPETAFLTVKSPKTVDGVHSVREEHEIETDAAATLHEMLRALGYQSAWVYEKRRTSWERPDDPGVIELDETPIGFFLEIEGPGPWIDAAAKELGFSESDYVTFNYRQFFERWREQRRLPELRDMSFAAVREVLR